MLKKDKQKVLGEHFDDARIKTFLDYQPYGEVNPDFHLLEKAYRGMKADNFASFLNFFIQEGHDINATNPEGQTFLQIISQHHQAVDYITAMKAKGAQY